MRRRNFLQAGIAGVVGTGVAKADALAPLFEELPKTDPMPAVFIGHGSPMNAIEDNAYTRSWKELAARLPEPAAILVVSAHWLTPGRTLVLGNTAPRTIHDFGGFPDELYAQQYPAPGSPDYAAATTRLLKDVHAELDDEWGLDHGTWSVLLPMYPRAEIPVFQVSIDYAKPPRYHYELAQKLRALRERGVLIVGSGNLVHNLRRMTPSGEAYDWAEEFESIMRGHLETGDFDSLVDFQSLGSVAQLAHPTIDHFLPVIYSAGMRLPKDETRTFNEGVDLGSISMLCFELSQTQG